MPTFDDEKKFAVDESTCDGRFRGKLYARSVSGLISLHPQWKPGPRTCIVPVEYFEKPLRKQNEEYDAEDSEEETSRESDSQSESDMINDCLAPEDEFKAVTMNHLRTGSLQSTLLHRNSWMPPWL